MGQPQSMPGSSALFVSFDQDVQTSYRLQPIREGGLHVLRSSAAGLTQGKAKVNISGWYHETQQAGRSESDSYERWARRLAVVQGAYYTATGLWPILHMDSFERVTGPKTDGWLVKTVGALISVLGGGLLTSGLHGSPSRDLAAVAAGSAAALTAIDVIYVARGRISEIYLLDAAAETVLIAGWTITLNM